MAQGLAGIPGAVVRSFTWDVGNTFGTGKFGESVFGPNRFSTPLVTAGQIGLAVQKTYNLSEKVFSDLITSTNYSLGAVANWTYVNKKEILKVVKEIIKFSLMFFFPGTQSLKAVKIVVGLFADFLDQEDLWSGTGPRKVLAGLNSGDYAKAYKTSAGMAAKLAGLVASCFITYGLVAKRGILGLSTKANKQFAQYAITLMQTKGALLYTGGVVADAYDPST